MQEATPGRLPLTSIEPGTKLLRDRQVDTQEVLVLEDGLLYRGR